MSIVRWGSDSDVYMYEHVEGFITCCGCRLARPLPIALRERARVHAAHWVTSWLDVLTGLARVATLGFWRVRTPFWWIIWSASRSPEREPDPQFTTYATARQHLEAHRAAGHQVPPRAFKRVQAEIARGRGPTDPYPPCKHGVPSEQICRACDHERAAILAADDAERDVHNAGSLM